MSNAIPGFKKKFALSLLSASLLIGLPGQTSATEMSGVATEVTALVNAASNAATLIEEALTQYNMYMTQINTYKQMFENLKKLPEDVQHLISKNQLKKLMPCCKADKKTSQHRANHRLSISSMR